MLSHVAPRRAAPFAVAFAIAVMALPAPGPLLLAHEGHDHGPAAPALPQTVKPRIAVHSDAYELVAIATGQRLTIFLDRYSSNAPVTDARIEIMDGSGTIAAEIQPDSTYRATLASIEKPGRHELIFNIQHKDGDDLLPGTLEIPLDSASAMAAQPVVGGSAVRPSGTTGWVAISVFGAVAILLGFVLGARWGRRRAMTLWLAPVVACLLAAGEAWSHEGHEPSPPPSAESLVGDIPRRLPDGSVFLPKPGQRLLTVRTQLAIEGEASRTATLVGRIIADPNRAGVVQSINGGRVSPPPGGLPRLGAEVKAGQPLAIIQPALPLADQSTLAEKGRELEGQILLAEQKLSRLVRLQAGTAPRSQIDDIELEIDNLKRRLGTLREARILPETLTSPIDGIVSASRVVAGQVVQAQDILFQIVDPKGLWVEALVFDQIDPGAVVAATAITPDGRRMSLAFQGRGRALQQQAVVLQFSIPEPDAGTAIGLPVTVIARKAETARGMLLPRDAVVRGASGESIVWQHVDPERFVARQVRIEPFDGEQVLVTAGIKPKDRVVVHGAELLSQVR